MVQARPGLPEEPHKSQAWGHRQLSTDRDMGQLWVREDNEGP